MAIGSVTNERCRLARKSQTAYASEKTPNARAPARRATTTATAKLKQTVNQITASCTGAGVTTLNIVAGTIKNG